MGGHNVFEAFASENTDYTQVTEAVMGLAEQQQSYNSVRAYILQSTGGAVDLDDLALGDQIRLNKTHNPETTAPFVFSFQNSTGIPGPSHFYDTDAARQRVVLPVPPSDLQVTLPNDQQIVTTISGMQYSHAGPLQLKEISFEGFFPYVSNPIAQHDQTVKNKWPQYIPEYVSAYKYYFPKQLVEKFETAMRANQPIFFGVYASAMGSLIDSSTVVIPIHTMSVSSFDWAMGSEVGGHRFDISYQITLKEWRKQQVCLHNYRKPQAKPPVNNGGERPPKPQYRLYKVRSGDTLWDIARRELGNAFRWREIYRLNKDKISNPDLIYPGQMLRIPKK